MHAQREDHDDKRERSHAQQQSFDDANDHVGCPKGWHQQPEQLRRIRLLMLEPVHEGTGRTCTLIRKLRSPPADPWIHLKGQG